MQKPKRAEKTPDDPLPPFGTWEWEVETARRAMSRDQNPLHIWRLVKSAVARAEQSAMHEAMDQPIQEAISSSKTAEPLPLPRWVWDYLAAVGWRLGEMANGLDWRRFPSDFDDEADHERYRNKPDLDAKGTKELLPSTLYFTRNGWNAFTNGKAKKIAKNMQIHVDSLIIKGMSAAAARDAVMQEFGYGDARSFRRLVQKADEPENGTSPFSVETR